MNNTEINKYGLSERDITTLTNIFDRHTSVKQIYIFGSRAKGTHRKGSDIDLAIMNTGVNEKELNKIKSELEESALPYLIDLIDFTTLQHKELKEHIEGTGVSFYKR